VSTPEISEYLSRKALHEYADVSDAIAQFVSDSPWESLPAPVVERVKKSILDVIGVGIYGSTYDVAQQPLNYVRAHPTEEVATIFRGNGRTSAFNAALTNGTFVHLTEFAEGFSRALVHPGNSIVPGVLALCERDHRHGRDLLAGTAVAYELNIRQGMSVEAPFNLDQGFHPPATLGGIAAAAGCARASGFDVETTANVLGVAACQVPTALMASTYEQVSQKDIQQGLNTALGVFAVDLVSAGVRGIHNWVGPWYNAVVRHKKIDKLTDRLGEYWHTSSGGIRIKTRPVMGMAQPTTWAIYDLLQKERFDPDLIEDVLVQSSQRVEFGRIYEVDNILGMRASIPFLAAAALVRQEEFASDFYCVNFLREELLEDERISALIKRVRLEADPEFDYNLEHAPPSDDPAHYVKFEARVTISLSDGRTLVSYKDVFAAGTGNMSRDDVASKFRACTDGRISSAKAEEIIDMVWRLDEVDDVAELARLAGST
jgi:2-methylcitrate dehydratase PrpD